MAWHALAQNDFPAAINHATRQLSKGLTTDGIRLATDVLKAKWDDALARIVIGLTSFSGFTDGYKMAEVNNISIQWMLLKQFDMAEEMLKSGEKYYSRVSPSTREYYSLNMAQLYRHKGQEIPRDLLDEVRTIEKKSVDPLSRFGANCCLGDSKKALAILQDAANGEVVGSFRKTEILEWPIALLLDKELLQKYREGQRMEDIPSSGGVEGSVHAPRRKRSSAG